MKKKLLMAAAWIAMMSVSLAACSDNKEDNIENVEVSKEDLSAYEGTWFGNEGSEYDYVIFDGSGNWEVYMNEQVVSNGSMEYVDKDDCYYVYNEQDGSETKCYLNEDGSLTFDIYGQFYQGGGENNNIEPLGLGNFIYYFDMWYKDGNMEETSILLYETGEWESYDNTGLIGAGTIEVDSETYNALILLDKSGEKAAYVQVDGNDVMNAEVYNEELLKLPQTCTLYREMESK